MNDVVINIVQGHKAVEHANVNIIVDPIRAFTVSHYAHLGNVDKLILVDSIENALQYKSSNTILSGEINGYKISEFDIGNSPYEVSKLDLRKKHLVQKTTNGVAVTLNSLDADHTFVTGYTNALKTAIYVKKIMKNFRKFKINIIASHPSGDDDLACAEYIEHIIMHNEYDEKSLHKKVVDRIVKSDAAQKFIDEHNTDFPMSDLIRCITPIDSDFVMAVRKDIDDNLPILIKEKL